MYIILKNIGQMKINIYKNKNEKKNRNLKIKWLKLIKVDLIKSYHLIGNKKNLFLNINFKNKKAF